MARDRATLKVDNRSEFGSRTTTRLRRQGLAPGGALIDVAFDDGKPTPVVVKEQQRHPVRDSLLHLDLLEVSLDEEIQAEVTVELLGTEEAPGVKEGGVLEHVTRELSIRALPTAIPESIAADVSGMEIGDNLQLSALIPPEDVEFIADEPDEVTIATLSPPRVEEEPEPELEEEAELVGEEGEEVPEGEEAPEGEAPAEGERAEGAG